MEKAIETEVRESERGVAQLKFIDSAQPTPEKNKRLKIPNESTEKSQKEENNRKPLDHIREYVSERTTDRTKALKRGQKESAPAKPVSLLRREQILEEQAPEHFGMERKKSAQPVITKSQQIIFRLMGVPENHFPPESPHFNPGSSVFSSNTVNLLDDTEPVQIEERDEANGITLVHSRIS
ncbi:MAG: hypothetical protein HYW00_00630 [Candidatus Colwellbacteria bacterium]|nr:hypothetical protein [Candidatus Colwellbacteria bacterium]